MKNKGELLLARPNRLDRSRLVAAPLESVSTKPSARRGSIDGPRGAISLSSKASQNTRWEENERRASVRLEAGKDPDDAKEDDEHGDAGLLAVAEPGGEKEGPAIA